MAQRTVVDCDCCKAKECVLEQGRFSVAVDRCLDAAGSSETQYEYIDLCPKCLGREFGKVLKDMDYGEAQKFVNAIRHK